jgi:eukaryotic-like serine/threonine-protein kinase
MVGIVITFGLMVPTTMSFTQASIKNPGVFPPDEIVFGKTYHLAILKKEKFRDLFRIETPATRLDAKELAARHDQSLDNQPTQPQMMTSLGSYRILSPLGRGGMGDVYLAEDTRLGGKVAIKLLLEEFTTDGEQVRRFEREARAASAINHPNILTIYEIGRSEGLHFIAAEYVEGQTLRQRMKQSRLSLREALDVAIQVASALNAAHTAAIIHRDIKPENIMVRPDGLVKVLDFGLAKLTERRATACDTQVSTIAGRTTELGVVMGTARYMSPEQARGLEVDARTDIFSLGVVIYEMMAGCAPFEGATTNDVIAAILKTEPPPLVFHVPEVSGEIENVISKALRKGCGSFRTTLSGHFTSLR